eukprot:scaffold79057_cov55-Cyclotella_meneghiniana.AAC.1
MIFNPNVIEKVTALDLEVFRAHSLSDDTKTNKKTNKKTIIENCNSNTNTVKAHGWEEKGGGSGKYPYAESTYEGAGYDFSKNESDVVVSNVKDGHGVRKINVTGGDKDVSEDEIKDKVVNDSSSLKNLFPLIPGLSMLASLGNCSNAKIGADTPTSRRNSMQMSWARLAMIALLICGFYSGAFADQTAISDQTNAEPFNLDTGLKNLQAIPSSLRGGEKGANSIGAIEQVKIFMRSLSNGLTSIQEHIRGDNAEEAAKILKDIVGDVNSVVETSNEMKHINGMNIGKLPKPFRGEEDFSNQMINLKDIPNSMLSEHMKPEIFDRLAKFSNEFATSLEEIDASTFEAAFTKKKNYLNSNHKGGKNNSPETEEHSHFKFGNSARIFSNFVKQSNSQSINKQNWIHRK